MSAQANILALSLVGLVGLALASTYEPPSHAPALPRGPDGEEPYEAYAAQLIATSQMQSATLSPAGREALAATLTQAASGIRSRSPKAALRLDAEAARLRGSSPPSTGQEEPPPPGAAADSERALLELQRRASDYLSGRSMGLEDAASLVTALREAALSVGPSSPLLPGIQRIVGFVLNPETVPNFGTPL